MELNTQAQQCEAVVQGRSLSPYRLRYKKAVLKFPKRNRQTQQHESVAQGRCLSPYWLRYKKTSRDFFCKFKSASFG
ncbi:MAG: hypothetical protein LBJ00_09925 [Planctomycetaceae bacterium]|nr:hypothetical protein [Planctomycetaceae bacterium]